MSLPVVITARAWTDTVDAVSWYDERQAGLGWRFWQHLKMTLRAIQRSPRLGPASGSRGIRRRNLTVFPYSAYYEIHGEEIRILAVWHGARNPRTLRQRLF